MSGPDAVYGAIDRAVERGELTDAEAREEYLAAREEALQQAAEEWDL